MKRTILSIFILSFFGFLSAQTVVFHEDFEQPSGADSVTAYSSSGSNTWEISTELAAGGLQSDSAKCSPNDTLTLTTNVFSTTGNAFVTLDFDHIAKFEIMDKAIVEVSIDNGASWAKLDSTHYMGTSSNFGSSGNLFNSSTYTDWKSSQPITPDNSWWKHEKFNISAIAADESNVQVRFSLIDNNGLTTFENYGWFLDNIEVAADPSELVPPEIVMGTPIVKDTVTSSNPQTIKAEITDDASGVDTAFVVYYINGTLTDTLGMTNFQADSFKTDIPFPGFGRTITYFVEAVDQSTAKNHGSSKNYSYFVKFKTGIHTVVFSEGFNGGSVPGNWTNNTQKPWDYETGSTTSGSTGPNGPYEGSGYVYTEASFGGVGANDTAALTSPSINLSNSKKPYLVFYYHMYGADMGELNVDIYDGTTWHQGVWSKSGEQHSSGSDLWTKVAIDITAYKDADTKIRFRGITGSSYASDMSLDDVKVGETQLDFPDAGIAEITNPTGGVVSNGNFDVKVKFQNKGGVNINEVDIDWELDGTSKSTYNWTGTLEPDSLSSEITLGTESVSSGPHNLKIWTTNPNDTVDFNIANDTMQFSFYGCDSLLSGTYSIGGSSPDYATFSDAVLALNQCGIAGPVTFNVASGTYDEQITLSDISGASSANTITFQSATGDSSDVTLQYAAANASENHVVKLEGSSHITFKDMTFKSQSNTWPRVFVINGGAGHVNLSNNSFEGLNLSGGTNGTDSALIITEDSVGSNLTIMHNYLEGGTRGLDVEGFNLTGVTVKHNEFINQWVISASISGANAPIVTHNYVSTNSMHNSYNGLRITGAEGNFELAYNEVYAPSTIVGYGLRVENSKGDSLNHARVFNNMVTIRGIDGSSTLSAGLINIESRFIDYYYNTFRTIGSDELAVPLCLYDNNPGKTKHLSIKNNIFANNTGGYILYSQNIDTTGFIQDYNNFYQSGSNIFGSLNGGNIADFKEFQSFTGQENHSTEYAPYFADTTELHVFNNNLKGLANPVPGITDDIDGDSRNATNPDMGADEFDLVAYDLSVAKIISPQSGCGLSSAEAITMRIKNIGTSAVNTFDAHYKILNTTINITETVNTTINAGDSLDFTFSATIDMNMDSLMQDSIFPLQAWITYQNDPIQQNDTTWKDVVSKYQPPAPSTSTFTANYADSITITATSNDTLLWYEHDTSITKIYKGKYFTTPLLYDTTTYWVSAIPSTGKQPIITEICHYQTSTGSPTGGWPSYLEADDYIEITGSPGADLKGITLEQWDENNLLNSHTFPKGTVLGPDGTAIIAVGSATNSTPSPSDYYYHGNVSNSFSSSTETGRILKDENGEIIDAVGYSGYNDYVFPSAAGVTSADWSGITPSGSSTSGNRLEGPYTKDATNWINSDGNPQDPNIKNAGLVLPEALSDCESPRVPVTVNVTGFPAVDAGITDIHNPVDTVTGCSPKHIEIILRNFGTNTLTSAEISWELDNTQQKTYNWSGSIQHDETDTVLIDTSMIKNGAQILRAWSEQPNNNTDTINSNDTITKAVYSNLPAPASVTVLDSSNSTVTFEWTAGNLGGSYIYTIVEHGDIIDNGTLFNVTTNSATAGNLNPLTLYDIYVAELCPGATDTSDWAGPVSFTTEFACPPGAYCFNNAGSTGPLGPAQQAVDSAYNGTPLKGSVTVIDSGIQKWVVPHTMNYTIFTYGAQGGGNGGKGAKVSGNFNLTKGDTLLILVGQQGEYESEVGGGGGGSFVVEKTNGKTPLIVAGGGGGGNSVYTGGGGRAQISGYPFGGFPAGGAGYSGDGAGSMGTNAKSFLNGGKGGKIDGLNSYGGFGGGGGGKDDSGSASSQDLGGGGGYEGGDGDYNGPGEGGYAYNTGTNSSLTANINPGHGKVVIEPEVPYTNVPNDAGILSIDDLDAFCSGAYDVFVTIANSGNNIINNVDIEWTVNGNSQPTYTYNGTLDTIGGSGSFFTQVNIGNYYFATGIPYKIKAWTKNPNSINDTVHFNDTANVTVQANLPAPTGITIDDVTPTSVTFSWDGGSSQHTWVYSIVPRGYSPQHGNYNISNNEQATYDSLTHITKYDLYLAEVCPGGVDTSAWEGPVEFKTPSGGLTCSGTSTPSTVFSENWSTMQGGWTGDIGNSNSKWRFGTTSTPTLNTGPKDAHDGPLFLYFDDDNTGSTSSGSLISPEINLALANKEAILSFWLHAYGNDIPGSKLTVSAGTNPVGPFTEVYSRTFNDELQNDHNEPYVQDFADLSDYVGKNIYLEFKFENPNSGNESDIALDLIEVEACNNPVLYQDAGIVDIPKPDYFNINTNKQFDVIVKNFGSDTIKNTTINYDYGSQSGTFNFNGSIAPQKETTVNMPAINLPGGGVNLCAYTSLPGDSNTNNDRSCKEIYRRYTSTIPYSDNLENKNYFMKDTSSLQTTQWELGTPQASTISNSHSGQNAWMTNLNGNYANNLYQDYLYTPRFAFSGYQPDSLVFWHHFDTESNDGGYIQYQNHNGNWSNLGTVNDTSAINWYNDTLSLGVEGFSGNSNGWTRSAICIDSSHITNMAAITQFRFIFTSDANGNNANGWAIDDFYIKVPKTDIDAGIQNIIKPQDSTVTSDSIEVTVEIRNHGYNTQTSIPVSYQIGNNTPVTETWTGNLTTDQTDTFTFNTKYLAPSSNYMITASTELSNDGIPQNDAIQKTVRAKPAAMDAGIVEIKPVGNSFGTTTLYQKDVKVKVLIHNYGAQNLTSFDVEYEQNNNTPVTETWTGNLASGNTIEYTFNQAFNVAVLGTYDVCARTLLSGDAYSQNNEYCTQWTGEVDNAISSNELNGFILHQNIPNPANEKTSVNFEVPYAGKAQFEVVDMFGRKLYSKDISVEAGKHKVNLNTKSWSSGIYYYSVAFDGYKLVRKIIVTK
ncbi:MAG: T9SS type A sorting domain-containing protein [Bacteroidales bacterium]|nr:T9SS type A sorting domain-containing protein [Bacteroidales bacterium]